MNNNKKYLIAALATAAVIILIIIFAVAGRKDNDTPAPQDSHDGHGAVSQEAPSSQASQNQETAPSAEASAPVDQYLAEQDQIMSDMMKNMEVEASGNASVDFLKGMIPHHQSAIDMAQSYLKYGGVNQDLKQLAEDIIQAQTGEMELMDQLIQEIEASGETDTEKEQGYLDAYNQMMAGHMHMGHGSSSSSVERAFAEGMIMHHQMAVDMSEAILDYTDHDQVRRLAEDIIAAQEKEILKMQEIMEQL